jgi:hypothetical protein
VNLFVYVAVCVVLAEFGQEAGIDVLWVQHWQALSQSQLWAVDSTAHSQKNMYYYCCQQRYLLYNT